jgi:RNA polymerase sigma-70 factor (ECF subfamily)
MTKAKLTDEQLIRALLEGEKGLYREFVVRYERLVRHVVSRMMANSHDVEDICQDVFVKIYINLSGFRFDSKLSTWVGRIAYNTSLNYLDKKRATLMADYGTDEDPMESWSDPEMATEQIAEGNDVAIKLSTEIDKLPVIYGTILSLFHLQDMRYGEIAEILSLPEGTVKSYLFRARRMLKVRLSVRYSAEELWA